MTIGTAIVCYNTPELITKAVNSVKDYVNEVLIINSSDKNNPAFLECQKLALNANVNVINTFKNIGHGPGLNLAIDNLNTELIICMDSDAILLDKGLIDEMKEIIKDPDVYGCGRVLNLKPKYLYLPFCMIKKEMFYQYHPFVHSGGPFEKTMKDIKGKKKIVDIKNFMSRVYHAGKSTRKIAGHWRKDFGGREGI
jgi:glycosyltransferase involved in cell wall biosynthesis